MSKRTYMVKRRRSWSERLFSRPWRPWVSTADVGRVTTMQIPGADHTEREEGRMSEQSGEKLPIRVWKNTRDRDTRIDGVTVPARATGDFSDVTPDARETEPGTEGCGGTGRIGGLRDVTGGGIGVRMEPCPGCAHPECPNRVGENERRDG